MTHFRWRWSRRVKGYQHRWVRPRRMAETIRRLIRDCVRHDRHCAEIRKGRRH